MVRLHENGSDFAAIILPCPTLPPELEAAPPTAVAAGPPLAAAVSDLPPLAAPAVAAWEGLGLLAIGDEDENRFMDEVAGFGVEGVESRPVNEGFHRLTANWCAADTVKTLKKNNYCHVCLSICLFVFMSVCLSVSLSVY